MVESRSWAPARSGLAVVSLLCFVAFPVSADDDDAEGSNSWRELPEWVNHIGVSGRYADAVTGSKSKYLEDHNIQTGPVLSLGIEDELPDEGILTIDGLAEPLQEQGYLLLNLDVPERFTLHADVQAWREYYNPRTGENPVTAAGAPVSGDFPNTNDSRQFFGGGRPKVDWLRTRSGIEIELPALLNDISADFIYRRVEGQMSLLKGGTIDTSDPIAGSGPFLESVNFDVSSRKKVDYESIGGVFRGRANPGGLNIQFDARGMRHDLKSIVREPNFGADAGSTQVEIYGRDTKIGILDGDLVMSRHLAHNLFVFGGASFSFERSDPEPNQLVQTGLFAAVPAGTFSRETLDSKVTRFTEALTGGAVYLPMRNLTIRANASLRFSQQDGDLTEDRQEGEFALGDVGTIINDSERKTVFASVRVKGDWRPMKRVKVIGFARFDFRRQKADSTRTFNFTPSIDLPEIEDYTTERTKFRVGGEASYRFRRGRTLSGGYEFAYVDFDNDVDQISNQFIMEDYEHLRHRIHVKAAGRITDKIRGELRAEYHFENRTLDAPAVQASDFTVEEDGKIEIQGFRITPMLTYQHDKHWSGVMSTSIGQENYHLKNAGPKPALFSSQFAGFEYEALTATLTSSLNWTPNDRMTNALSYTLYHNSESVENVGHDASVRTRYALDENWDLSGMLRYLAFDPSGNSVDDYHALIVSVGMTGHF